MSRETDGAFPDAPRSWRRRQVPSDAANPCLASAFPDPIQGFIYK